MNLTWGKTVADIGMVHGDVQLNPLNQGENT